MKVLGFLLLSTFLTIQVSAKNADHTDPVTTAPPAAAPNFYETNIEPILDALQAGHVTSEDPNCNNPTYSAYSNLVTATVNGKNYYITLNPTSVNGLNYNPSSCQLTKLSNGASEIDCAAVEQNPVTPPGTTLSFVMVYTQTGSNPNFYTVYKCPQSAQ